MAADTRPAEADERVAGRATRLRARVDYDRLPSGTVTTLVPITAADGVGSLGILHTRGGERTVVISTHPRSDLSRHYAAPAILEAGYAFYGHQCRGLNNDVDCEHERLLFDLAAALKHLKEERGFECIVLLGNSGGGSLLTFYQQQARTAPPGRLTDTAAGDPCDLNALDMPVADGVIVLAAHPGEGKSMLAWIDPSVVDEFDPVAVDPTLDMYNPDNGFREPPEPSTYSTEFLDRYRAAQLARVARIDAIARSRIEEAEHHRKVIGRPGFDELGLGERQYAERRSFVGHHLVIYRTEAHPAYTDLSLHAWRSTREVGSLVGPRPDRQNYAPQGFGRYLTPRAWLSTWSALSSRAALEDCIKAIHEPLLLINYTADALCFPDDSQAQFDSCPAQDKTLQFFDAEHFGLPLTERAKAMQSLVAWLLDRFPARRS
ncbi:hypothetical protein ABZX85_46995 [Streptomyces sp. NPDC004539]|uniref:hypothetical protein n=1 Tax=Streptomyces sp. NPDC004539 TaxID=3154280 RepID=UPI0033BCCEAC